jgi:hypothetical protein
MTALATTCAAFPYTCNVPVSLSQLLATPHAYLSAHLLFSPFALLCLSLYATRSARVKPS